MQAMALEAQGTSDRELLAEFVAQGSQDAFALLVQRHSNLVFSVCLRILQDRSSAEDAAQAAFLVLFQKAATLTPDTVLASWLYRVAELSAHDVRRAMKRRARHEMEAQTMTKQPVDPALWEDVRPHLNNALSSLPGKMRDVLVLRYFRGQSRAEIAQELSCPEGTVQIRLSRGLQKLRERLRRSGVHVPMLALADLLRDRAVEVAPAGFAASAANACLGKAAPSVSAAATALHVASGLFWTPVKLYILPAAAAILLVSIVPLVRGNGGNSEEGTPAVPAPELQERVPAQGQAAILSKQEEDHDGLHLDDPKIWLVTAMNPVRTFPALIEMPLMENGRFGAVTVTHQRRWDLAQGAVALHVTFFMAPKPPRGASFKIRAILDPDAMSPEKSNQFLSLMYLAHDESLTSSKVNHPSKGIQTMDRRSLAPGKHVLELAVSSQEWLTCLDGQPVYRGAHGVSVSTIQFAFQTVYNPSAGDDATVFVEHVGIGPSKRLEAKPQEDF